MRFAFTLVLAVCAWPMRSEAYCVSVPCFCDTRKTPDAPRVLEGTITAVNGPRTVFDVNGSALTLPREMGDAAGGVWLIFMDGDELWRRTPITNGSITCAGSSSVSFTIAEATAMFASATCANQVEAAGFVQACNDRGRTCSIAAGPLVSAFLLLWLRRRRQW